MFSNKYRAGGNPSGVTTDEIILQRLMYMLKSFDAAYRNYLSMRRCGFYDEKFELNSAIVGESICLEIAAHFETMRRKYDAVGFLEAALSWDKLFRAAPDEPPDLIRVGATAGFTTRMMGDF